MAAVAAAKAEEGRAAAKAAYDTAAIPQDKYEGAVQDLSATIERMRGRGSFLTVSP